MSGRVPGAPRKPTLALMVAAPIIVIGLSVIYSHRGGDFAGYLAVGEIGLKGGDVYRDAPPLVNTWPPLFGLLCIPLALAGRLSLVGARFGWLLLNWIALGAAFAAMIRLVYGKPITLTWRGEPPAGGVEAASAAVLLPFLLCILWILSNFEHLQVNIIIFALTLAGLLQHQAGRDGRAGLLIGVATALKVMPVLFLPYFLWRRRWRAALGLIVAACALSLLPAAFDGWARFADQLTAWRAALSAGWGVGMMNLSVYAMADRMLGHGMIPFAAPGVLDLAASGRPAVLWVVGGLLALVTAAACWLFRGPYDARRRSAVAEWSVVLLVAALFGTVAWKAYLIVLLLPMVLFVATWRDAAVDAGFRRTLRALTWVTFTLGLGTATDLVGRDLAGHLEMGSIQTLMALLLLGMLFWYRARIGRVGDTSGVP